MRLTDTVKNGIIKASKKHFGDASLYLFGSRVDDAKKGGDIDLFVESKNNIDVDTRMSFLSNIHKSITERKIDLIVKTPRYGNQEIFDVAKKTGVKLC
jgi:predicted nucleotidyltransferase